VRFFTNYVHVNELLWLWVVPDYIVAYRSGFGGIHNLLLFLWINHVGLNFELCSII